MIKHKSADLGLIFCAYNLRCIFNLIDQNLLQQYLKVLALNFGDLERFLNPFTPYFLLRK